MLEWLKSILGDSYTDEIDKKVSTEIGKSFVAKADFNALNETKKTLEGTISERDSQLEALKKLEPEKLQAEITRLQSENTAAKTKYDDDLKQFKKDTLLEAKLLKEGAINTKAVKALLDHSKIALDGENLIGIDDQLKSLKESEKWAWNTAPGVSGEGGNPAGPETEPKTPLPSGTVIF